MKVLIVTPYFAPHPGGVENYTFNMAKQLTKSGWEVVVVTSSQDGETATKTIQGIRVYYLKKAFLVSNTPVGWWWRKQLKKIYAIEKPDVINGHEPVPYMADIAERCRGRIPFVLTYHNDLSKSKMPQKLIASILNRTSIKRTLRRSDHVIATSQYYIDTSPLLKQYMKKVSVVSPGVDTTLYNPQVKPVQLKSKHDTERVILFVGSVGKNQQHKGLDMLIQTFAELRSAAAFSDTRLVVVGAGDGVDMYAALAESLHVGDVVEFTGYVKNELLARYYKRATVMVMPSRDRSEGFGMVFMEANAVGTPVIGTRVGGIPYAIQHNETGLLVAPGNSKALASALRKILTDSKLAKRLGDTGAKRAVAEFDWALLSQQTADCLTSAARPTVIQVAGYYPPNLGGMERVAQELSENLAERSYDVQVLTSNVNQPAHPKLPKQPHLHIRRLKAFEFAHTAFAPAFIPALFRVPKRSIIHLHLSQAFYPEWTLLISKLRRIPYVVHFHLDLMPSGPLGALFIPYKAIVIRAVIKHANAVIVFSPEQQNFIHETYGLDMKRIVIIPNGVGSEYFVQRPKGVKRSMTKLLYLGRISPQKRVQFLTGALALMHEPAELTIVGDGEMRVSVESGVPKDIASRVHFTGQLSPEQTLPYFKEADVFVMASRVEGMPLAILEAMASGLPIVGADVSGIKELISDVGILVKEPSAASFARSLDELLAHPAKLEELSRKSSISAQAYSWSALIEHLETLYKEIGP